MHPETTGARQGCLPVFRELLGCLTVMALSVVFAAFVFGCELERSPSFKTPTTRVSSSLPRTGPSTPGPFVVPAETSPSASAPKAREIPPAIRRNPAELIRNVEAVQGRDVPAGQGQGARPPREA